MFTRSSRLTLSLTDEAGFESLKGTEDTVVNSRIYSEKVICMAKGFVQHALAHEVPGIDDVISWLYIEPKGPMLLRTVVDEAKSLAAKGDRMDDTERAGNPERLSAGAKVLLMRHMPFLERRLAGILQAQAADQ